MFGRGDELLEDGVLDGAPERLAVDAAPVGQRDVEGQHDRRRRVDRHARRDLVEGDVLEEVLDVGERVDGHADAADLALGVRVVRVVARQRGVVEVGGEAGLAGVEEVLVAIVGLLCRLEAGDLAVGPQLPAVHRRVGAAGERRLAGEPEVALVVEVRDVRWRVQPLALVAREGPEGLLALGVGLEPRRERVALPLVVGLHKLREALLVGQ
jgi:hypothetical protein